MSLQSAHETSALRKPAVSLSTGAQEAQHKARSAVISCARSVDDAAHAGRQWAVKAATKDMEKPRKRLMLEDRELF